MALELQLFNNAPGGFQPQKGPELRGELDRAGSILRETAAVQRQGILDNVRIESEAEAAQTVRNMEMLKGFSDTAFKFVDDYRKNQEKELEAEYYAKALRGEVSLGDPIQYEAEKLQDAAADQNISALAWNAQANGAPPATAMRLFELSGAKRRGAEKGILRLKALEYNVALEDFSRQLSTLPPGQQEAALAKFQRDFINQNQLTQFRPEAFVDLFGEATIAAQGRAIAKARQQYAINTGEEVLDAKLSEYEANKDVLGFINGTTGVYTENGPLGRKGAWDLWFKQTKEMIDAGRLSIEDLDDMGAQIDPETGKRLDKRWATRFGLLKQAIQDEQIEGYRRQETLDDSAFEQAEEMSLSEFSNPANPPTDAQIDEVQSALFQKYQRRSTRLDELKQGDTVDAQQRKELDASLKRRAELGILMPEDLRHLPWDIQQKWSSVAQQQGGAPKGEIKAQLDAVENAVWNIPSVKANPQGKLDPVAQLVVGSLQNEFRRRYAKYLQQGMEPAAASEQAGAEMVDYLNRSQNTPGGKYFVDPKTGKFSTFMQNGNWSGGAKDHLNRVETIKQVLGSVGWNGAISSPGLFISEAEAKAMGSSGVFQVPPLVQYYSNKYNRNPMEIINAQRKAMGMPEFALTPSLKAAQGLDQRTQGLINRFPSQNRFIRASGGRGGFPTFESSLVPNNLGKVIESAAKANGLDPALFAGLLDHESMGFNPDVIAGRRLSSAGAVGVAQIMPQYHPGVDPKDPVASIQYAAKYLKQLREQFGSLNKAIYAYNAGPGNVERYGGPIPGDRESQEYLKNVLKATAKYRKNPELWSSGLLGRGRFRVVEHVTGDRTHPNYAEDHGGRNYHEHIAFQTKAQRDEAIKLYKSLGYRVTSVDRNDGGYHGAGLAIDVAPPLDLPMDKMSEAQWSRQARAVIGL